MAIEMKKTKVKILWNNLLKLEQKHWHKNMDTEHKKSKGTNVIKRDLTLQNYEYWLFNDKIMLKSQKRFKSDCHNVYTEQINKIALSSNDDKR